MKVCNFFGLGVALALSGSVSAQPPVVMLSIDGLRPDFVLEADRYRLKIPNLRRLLKEGAHARGVHIFLPTLTYPGHTTMVTGVAPDHHGIVENQPFDPLSLNSRGWCWYAEDIRVPTLWDIAAQAHVSMASVDWPVTVGAPIPFLIPQYWRASTTEDNKLLRALATPGLLTEVEKAGGPYPVNSEYSVAGDHQRAAAAVYVLEKKRPHLMLAYLGGLDEEEHSSGPFSAATMATLEEIDGLVGQLWQAALKVGGGHATFAVVSDHGFAPLEKGVFLNEQLRREGLIEVNAQGRVSHWQAFVWNALGSGAIILAKDTPPSVRGEVWELLQTLARDPENGIDQVLLGPAISRLGGFPDAAFVVLLKPGYSLYNDLGPGPLVRPVQDQGTHGYSPEEPQMNASFFAAGPGLSAGQDLGFIDARDIAPTVAGFLKLAMPSAEGKDLFRAAK